VVSNNGRESSRELLWRGTNGYHTGIEEKEKDWRLLQYVDHKTGESTTGRRSRDGKSSGANGSLEEEGITVEEASKGRLEEQLGPASSAMLVWQENRQERGGVPLNFENGLMRMLCWSEYTSRVE